MAMPIYNPTGPRAGYITPTRPYRKPKKPPYIVTDFFNPNNQPGRGRATERPVATTTRTGTGGGSLTAALAAGSANPWDSYLKTINQQENDLMERMLRSRQQSTLDYMAALRGFGGAVSGAVADSWGRVLGGQQRAADAIGSYSSGIADDYTMGLRAANEQIARDFASVGQEGGPNIRDTAAAAGQVATVGGQKPGEVMGLVGENWKNYAGTVPGNLDFMTEQNLMQAVREGSTADEEIRREFMQAAMDNPQDAMEMWDAVQKWQWAKDDRTAATAKAKVDAKLAKVKAAREAKAFNLQVQAFNLKYGSEMADRADQLSERSGTLWIYNPKTGQFDNTGQPTEDRRQANVQATTTRRGQTLTAQAAKSRMMNQNEQNRLSRLLRERGLDLQAQNITKDETKVKTMSVPQYRLWSQKAGQIATDWYQGKKSGTGKVLQDRGSAEDALREMRSKGIPLSIALDAIVPYARTKNSPWAYAKPWRRPGLARPPRG